MVGIMLQNNGSILETVTIILIMTHPYTFVHIYSISNQTEFNDIVNSLMNDSELRSASGAKNHDYIRKNKGAVVQILDYLRR